MKRRGVRPSIRMKYSEIHRDTHNSEPDAMICTVENEIKVKNAVANVMYFNHFPTKCSMIS